MLMNPEIGVQTQVIEPLHNDFQVFLPKRIG